MSICKNYKKKNYTGKENTPLGLGYHAEGEKIDKKMKGKDGHMYKVIKTKIGKRWLKIKKIKRTKLGEFVKKEDINILKLPDETIGIIGKAAPGQKNVPDFVFGIKPFIPGMELYLDSILPNHKNEYCKIDTYPIDIDNVYFTKGMKGIYTKFKMTRNLNDPNGLWLIYGISATNKEINFGDS